MRARLSWTALVAVLMIGLIAMKASAQQGGGDVQRGGQLFVSNCAVCHGADGRGRVGADLHAFPGIQVNAEITQTVRDGIPGSPMPAWGAANGGPLSDQDISDIVAYIVSAFAGTSPIEPLPTYLAPPVTPLPGIPGDASAGGVVYAANCAVCHGDRGQGRIGRTLAKTWEGTDPTAYIRQVVHDGIPGSAMPAWSQSRGGPLTEADIANVGAFVLTFSPAASLPTPIAPTGGPLGRGSSLILLGVLALVVVVVLVAYYLRT